LFVKDLIIIVLSIFPLLFFFIIKEAKASILVQAELPNIQCALGYQEALLGELIKLGVPESEEKKSKLIQSIRQRGGSNVFALLLWCYLPKF